jgi:hypothetical protein
MTNDQLSDLQREVLRVQYQSAAYAAGESFSHTDALTEVVGITVHRYGGSGNIYINLNVVNVIGLESESLSTKTTEEEFLSHVTKVTQMFIQLHNIF